MDSARITYTEIAFAVACIFQLAPDQVPANPRFTARVPERFAILRKHNGLPPL